MSKEWFEELAQKVPEPEGAFCARSSPRSSIETMRELTEELKNVDTENMAAFALIVRRATEALNISNETLAVDFSVSIPTVERWKEGVNAPYLGTRGIVISYFLKQASMKELIEDLKNADPRSNSLFPTLVVRAVEALNLSDRDLAFRFSATRPTIQRWKTGEGMPHPAMRVAVYRHFVESLEAKLAGQPASD